LARADRLMGKQWLASRVTRLSEAHLPPNFWPAMVCVRQSPPVQWQAHGTEVPPYKTTLMSTLSFRLRVYITSTCVQTFVDAHHRKLQMSALPARYPSVYGHLYGHHTRRGCTQHMCSDTHVSKLTLCSASVYVPSYGEEMSGSLRIIGSRWR